MPKVLQYGADQVRTQVAPQPKATGLPAAAFGAPIAQGVLDIAQAGAKLKQRVDITSSEEALVNFERDKNDLFFNPDSGYFNSQGRDAYDKSPEAIKALDELKNRYGETLNDNSKLLFDKAADAHITRSRMDVNKHASKGLKAWEIATIESQVENSVENASLYWNEPDRLKVQNILGRQATFDAAKMAGLSYEATAEKVQTYESAFARAAIEAATQSSSVEGKNALETYGDRLEGPDKVKMDKAIEAKAKVEKTEADGRAATLTASRLVDQFDTKGEIIEEVNKIEDPDLRKQTMTESMTQYTRKQQAEKEVQESYYNQGIDHFNNGGTAGAFQAQNPEAWEGMSPTQRNNLLAGKHMTTDQIQFNNLLSLPRGQLSQINPAEYSDVFKPSDVKILRTAVDKAKRGQSVTSVQTAAQKTKLVAEQFFGKQSTWKGNKVKSEKVQALMTAVQGSIEEAEELKGGKLKPSEIDEVMADFSRRFVVERSLAGFDYLSPDLNIDLSNTPPEQVSELSRFIEQHGDSSLQMVADRLKKEKKPVTIETILNTFRQATR